MKEGKEDMPLVGKTMAEGHTHRMAVLCEKLGSTLREILDGTCPQPAKPEKAPNMAKWGVQIWAGISSAD